MKVNKGFLKKIPDNAEAALVLEGKLPGKLGSVHKSHIS